MSGIFGELHRTAQALAAHSQGVFTAGRNMANVNNPAYARQRVVLGDRGTVQTPLGPQSLGVEALGLQAVRDRLLDEQVLRETSLMTSLEVQADAYYKGELALGQQIDRQGDSSFIEGASSTDASHGIGEAIDDLFNGFSSLAASPRSSAERQAVFQQAQTLVGRLHSADRRLSEIQQDLDTQIGIDVDSVNNLLTAISDLNQQIGRYEIGKPGSALDLRDQRQARLEELSKFIDIDVEEIPDSAGQIRLLSHDAGNNPVVLLDSANPFTPIAFDGTNFTGGEPPTVLALQGGRLLGAVTARDGAIADLRTGLDRLASQLVSAVNGAYNPGGLSTDFFTTTGVTAATIEVDPSVTSENIRATATTAPGANDIALAVANLASTVFSTGSGDAFDGSFGNYYRSLVSDLANATASANSRFEDQSTLQKMMLTRRDSVSGVSLDEEMTDLMKFQRAFEGSARIMRTLDEMLQAVVNLGR